MRLTSIAALISTTSASFLPSRQTDPCIPPMRHRPSFTLASAIRSPHSGSLADPHRVEHLLHGATELQPDAKGDELVVVRRRRIRVDLHGPLVLNDTGSLAGGQARARLADHVLPSLVAHRQLADDVGLRPG